MIGKYYGGGIEKKAMTMAKRRGRFVMRLRLAVVKGVCSLLLPRNVWVGLHFGAYTQKWSVYFGQLDNRGVLQGLNEREILEDYSAASELNKKGVRDNGND